MSAQKKARIISRRELTGPNGNATIVVLQAAGDPRVSIYCRYWLENESMHDAPEIRVRVSREQLAQFFALAIEQCKALLRAA